MQLISALTLSALLSVASSSVVDLDRRDSPLALSLTVVGNTKVKAKLSNTGSSDLKVLSKGTFLDKAPVEKVRVFGANSQVAFQGIRVQVLRSNLQEDAFTFIGAKQTLDFEFDIARVHNLNDGGEFTVYAAGALPYALGNTTELATDALSYASNSLTVNVDGVQAARVKLAISESKMRSAVGSDCSGSRRTATTNALSNCAQLASAAASAAQSGSATKFSEYFKSTSSSVRNTVAARLRAVASECSSTTSGATTSHCNDPYGYCDSNVLAYTLPASDYVVNCPLYFNALPALTKSCHAQDQATTTLHEMTHAPGVYSPGTDDLGYGYAAATRLSSANAVMNADSYALYANAIYSGC